MVVLLLLLHRRVELLPGLLMQIMLHILLLLGLGRLWSHLGVLQLLLGMLESLWMLLWMKLLLLWMKLMWRMKLLLLLYVWWRRRRVAVAGTRLRYVRRGWGRILLPLLGVRPRPRGS